MEELNVLINKNGTTIMQDPYGKIYITAENKDSVVILARESDSFIFIRQFRRAVNDFVIQLPGGGVEPGEQHEQAARREFLEETGYECGKVHLLGRLFPASWRSNEVTHVYYTDEVTSFTQQRLEKYEDINVIRISIRESIEQIRQGSINDSELAYAILQAILLGLIKVEAD